MGEAPHETDGGGAAGAFEAPRYGAASLPDLMPSVLASLGVPNEENVLGLPPARRACVLLIDGMGWEPLLAERDRVPFLSSLIGGPDASGPVGPLTASFPTTTATSLASLGTGSVPGHHGIIGYQAAVPGSDTVLNQLKWDAPVDPEQWQPHPTVFQRAEQEGVAAGYVASGAFEGGGLTRAIARGARYVPAGDPTDLAVRAADLLAAEERALAFVYHADLDAYGHMFGLDSDHWRLHLGHVDRLAEHIAGALPPGTALYITADHGMVDAAPDRRVDLDAAPGLMAGVRAVAGEARMRQVYTEPGAAPDVLAAWTEGLAGLAQVLSREQAVAEGRFGAVAPDVLPRIGDVLALARGTTTLVRPSAEPVESALIGHHGSLTPAEVRVPLLRFAADG